VEDVASRALKKLRNETKSWQSDLFIFCGVSTQLLLGTLEKLRKAVISFVLPVCLSARPHGTTRLSFD